MPEQLEGRTTDPAREPGAPAAERVFQTPALMTWYRGAGRVDQCGSRAGGQGRGTDTVLLGRMAATLNLAYDQALLDALTMGDGMGVATATVRAVNGLTARWARDSEGGTVFSAAGVWPLLAHLANGAEGAARAELAEALGLPAGQAADSASELLAAMSAMRGLDTALGLWTKRTLELRHEWEAGLSADVHGVLTGTLCPTIGRWTPGR